MKRLKNLEQAKRFVKAKIFFIILGISILLNFILIYSCFAHRGVHICRTEISPPIYVKCPALRSDGSVTFREMNEASLVFNGNKVSLGTESGSCREIGLNSNSCVYLNVAGVVKVDSSKKASWYSLDGLDVYRGDKQLCIPINVPLNSCIELKEN